MNNTLLSERNAQLFCPFLNIIKVKNKMKVMKYTLVDTFCINSKFDIAYQYGIIE